MALIWSTLKSTDTGEHNSLDDRLNKQQVSSTSQHDLFIMNPNKCNVAKLGDPSITSEAEGREFAKFSRSVEQFIHETPEQCLVTKCFFTLFQVD